MTLLELLILIGIGACMVLYHLRQVYELLETEGEKGLMSRAEFMTRTTLYERLSVRYQEALLLLGRTMRRDTPAAEEFVRWYFQTVGELAHWLFSQKRSRLQGEVIQASSVNDYLFRLDVALHDIADRIPPDDADAAINAVLSGKAGRRDVPDMVQHVEELESRVARHHYHAVELRSGWAIGYVDEQGEERILFEYPPGKGDEWQARELAARANLEDARPRMILQMPEDIEQLIRERPEPSIGTVQR